VAYEPKNRKKLSETELILRGANMAASGIKEGYTPEQTIDMLMKYFQRQGVTDIQGYAQNSLNEALEFTPETAEITNRKRISADSALKKQSEGVRHRGEMKDPNSLEERFKEAEIWGQDQSDFQQWGGFDKDARTPGGISGLTSSYAADREGKIEAGLLSPDDMNDREKLIRNEARSRENLGTGGVQDALNRLQVKIAEVGYAALPPETAEVERRLIDSLQYGKVQRGAERSLVRDMVINDNRRFNDAIAKENYQRAADEAQSIASRFTLGGKGADADDALRSIGRISRLGQVKAKAPFSIVPDSDVSNFGNAEWQGIPGASDSSWNTGLPDNEITGYYLDPRTGEPIAISESPSTAISGVNTPTTAQALNAPVSQSSIDWVTKAIPGGEDRGGGLNFGNYPQVDIGRVTSDLSIRLQALGAKEPSIYPTLQSTPANIRTFAEFDTAIQGVLEGRASKGQGFYMRDELTNRPKYVENPGPSEVLNSLGFSSTEEDSIRNALWQLELADESARKAAYQSRTQGTTASPKDLVFAAPEAVDRSRGTAEVGQINENLRMKDTGKYIKGLLRAIPDYPDASKPFIGATADEGEPKLKRQRAGGMDPTDVRIQQESYARKNLKLPSNAPIYYRGENELLQHQGVDSDEQRAYIQKVRNYQENNASLTEDVKKELRSRGESVGFLTKGPSSRPLPKRIATSPALDIDPNSVDMTEGFDYDAWSRRQTDPKQQVAPKPTTGIANEAYSRLLNRVAGKQQQTKTATPLPLNKPPTRTAVGVSSQPPWHRGKKRYIAAGATGLGTLGLLANEYNRRQDQEEELRY